MSEGVEPTEAGGAGVRAIVAEAFGTFVLVFAGTGALVTDEVTGGAVTHVGVALTFGLVVMALIHSLGDVSGAHLNPAISVGFWAARRFPGRRVLPYVGAQACGALAASVLIAALFPTSSTLGATVPRGPELQSAVLEFVLTIILMFVILSVATGSKEKGALAGIAIGGVIALEALFAGPISGASMNPARSLGPAVISGKLSALWLYLVAPTAGAIVAVGVCRAVQRPGCCSALGEC